MKQNFPKPLKLSFSAFDAKRKVFSRQYTKLRNKVISALLDNKRDKSVTPCRFGAIYLNCAASPSLACLAGWLPNFCIFLRLLGELKYSSE